MKRILFLVFLGILSNLLAFPQTVEPGDSTLTLTLEEVRILTKMTEDLKWTKEELAMADSIIAHQESIISLKDQMIEYKELQITQNLREFKTKKIKTGILSGGIGILVGILVGLLI